MIAGAGLFGAVCAAELHRAGKSCLVVEQRGHVGGAIRTELRHGMHVHLHARTSSIRRTARYGTT